MFKFRLAKLIALALVALFWTVACSPQATTNNPAQSQPLTVTTSPWPGYSGHYVARVSASQTLLTSGLA